MKYLTRCFLVLIFVMALVPAGRTAAAADPADPFCKDEAERLGAATFESLESEDGAISCVIYPARWNRDMVVFAHGYVDARQSIGIPWDQLQRTTPNLHELILNMGYAFGTTSYSKNGLAIKQGVADIVNLVRHVRQVKRAVRRVYLTGVSEGGAVTALAVEKYPMLFTAAMSTCGPIGDFQEQVQYWGNFRVAFDSYFPNALLNLQVLIDPTTGLPTTDPTKGVPVALPSTPILINPVVVQNWELVRDGVVTPMLLANIPAVQALIAQTQVPFDPGNLNTMGESILGLLYYNVEATNDGRTTLVPGANIFYPGSLEGNPYSNPGYVTPFYPQGITTDPAAITEIEAYYDTSGKLRRPMVVMHTTGDPIVPFNQSVLYAQKVAARDHLDKLIPLPIVRYGHCNFTAPEILFGFSLMVLRGTLTPFSAGQVQAALPDPQDQAEYKQLQRQFRDRLGR